MSMPAGEQMDLTEWGAPALPNGWSYVVVYDKASPPKNAVVEIRTKGETVVALAYAFFLTGPREPALVEAAHKARMRLSQEVDAGRVVLAEPEKGLYADAEFVELRPPAAGPVAYIVGVVLVILVVLVVGVISWNSSRPDAPTERERVCEQTARLLDEDGSMSFGEAYRQCMSMYD